MCTLSFQPLTTGFALAINRDEQRTRVDALPPALFPTSSGQAIYPREPSGGTWIGLNSDGLAFALINWYEKTVAGKPNKSRGSLIPALLQLSNLGAVESEINSLSLPSFAPFRLFGLDVSRQQLVGWNWDGRQLRKENYPWHARHWFSSGYDEAQASLIRAQTVEQARQESDAGTLPWLRRLHQSHEPQSGPNAICMHRKDAVTVSYTEIIAHPKGAEMRYHPGAPCCQNEHLITRLDFNL